MSENFGLRSLALAALLTCSSLACDRGVIAEPPPKPAAVTRPEPAPGETAATSAAPSATDLARATPALTANATLVAEATTHFAVIGDYGYSGEAEKAVATLVKSWDPEFVITTGDNNYPEGSAETIDRNIGQYFHEFIHPYKGRFGKGADKNRFFPSLGNHDWYTTGAQPYLDYFTLPGNERYYDLVWGDVHLFAIDSDEREPDGIDSASRQAKWLKAKLASSKAPWKIVFFHHPPYSSARHGSSALLQWPFKAWGASLVLAGHDHTYERLVIDDFPYVVNGLGGVSVYDFSPPIPGSVVRFNSQFGAMVADANAGELAFRFVSVDGVTRDAFKLTRPSLAP